MGLGQGGGAYSEFRRRFGALRVLPFGISAATCGGKIGFGFPLCPFPFPPWKGMPFPWRFFIRFLV